MFVVIKQKVGEVTDMRHSLHHPREGKKKKQC